MNNSKSSKCFYFLILFLFAVIFYLVFYILDGREMIKINSHFFKKIDSISQDKLVNIVESDLFILFKKDVKSLSDITNDDKLYVALNKLKSDKNELYDLDDFSKDDLDNSFSKTCISQLSINHKSFDIYVYDDGIYRVINPDALSTMYYSYVFPIAKKVSNFLINDGKYTLSIKYIFPDDTPPIYGYGSINNIIKEDNPVVRIMPEDAPGETIDVQKYLDDNYDRIKDELATYNYVFSKDNGKISIVDFYID